MTMIVNLGPQHPALKEVESFKLEVKGEEIVDVDLRLGYSHRGIERAMQERNYVKNTYLSERVCGICNVAHSANYCQAVELLAGVEIPPRAKAIRTILNELERLHSHLLWAGVAFHEIGFDTLFMYIWRDRELVLDVREAISGARQLSATNTPGGVRREIRLEHIPFLLDVLKKMEKSLKYYLGVAKSDRTVLARCRGVGVLPKSDALRLCATGPTARASGIDYDLRRDDPYMLYGEIPFNVIVEDGGDILARILVRLREMLESIFIIRKVVDEIPSGPIRAKFPEKVEANEAVDRTEAPRGELLYFVKSNGTDKPERVRIKTPTYSNVPSWKPMFRGATTADVPIIVASIDPCFTCNDRVSIVDVGSGKTEITSLQELRRLKRW